MKPLPRPSGLAAATAVGIALALGAAAHHPMARPAVRPKETVPALASASPAPSAPLAASVRTIATSRTTRSVAPPAKSVAPAMPIPTSRRYALAPGAAGMVVGVDPETGTLGPATIEQRVELARLSQAERMALSHSDEGLVEVHHPNGAVSVDLQGRFQEIAVIHIDRNGRRTFRCVEDSLEAVRALQGEGSRPAALEEE